MKRPHFSSHLLNAFVTLAQCRQFTVASELCHMSQSAFSQAISRLEGQVGVRLFDRTTRSVALTPEGEMFLPFARASLTEFESVLGELRDHAELRKGRVAIAAQPALAAEWIPRVLAEFRRRHPRTTLQLYDVVYERTVELLREGRVDFAVSAEAGHEEEFETLLLYEDRFFVVCPTDHPLAARRRLELKHLAGHDYIHSLRTGSVWPRLSPLLRSVPIKDTGLELAHVSTIAGLVAHGMGVSIVTGDTLFHFTRLKLRAVPITDRRLRYEVRAVKRRGRSLSVAAQALFDLLRVNTPQRHKIGTSGTPACALPRRSWGRLVDDGT